MNYIKDVKRDPFGLVHRVVAGLDDSLIAFQFDNGKPVREKSAVFLDIPSEEYGKIIRQVSAIYLESLKERNLNHLPLRLVKSGWKERERQRLNNLIRYHCEVYPNGFLVILRFDADKIIEMPYQDIDSAIRAQIHIMENYQKEVVTANEERLADVIRILKFVHERQMTLLAEKWNMGNSLRYAARIAKGMLNTANFFNYACFSHRINDLKYALSCAWLLPHFEIARHCLSALNEITNKVKAKDHIENCLDILLKASNEK